MIRKYTCRLRGEYIEVEAEVGRCADERGPYPEVGVIGWEGAADLSDADLDDLKAQIENMLEER